MIIERLVVASKNADKIAEVESVLHEAGVAREIVRGLDWPNVVEDGETLQANALLKARAVAAAIGLPAVADDTGLFVRAINDEPGIFAARYAGPDATYSDNVRHLLARMAGREDRHAEFRTAVAMVWPGQAAEEVVTLGVLEGRIIHDPRGGGGFGYDPIFEVDGRTLAEIPVAEKNRMSHRYRALATLADALRRRDA